MTKNGTNVSRGEDHQCVRLSNNTCGESPPEDQKPDIEDNMPLRVQGTAAGGTRPDDEEGSLKGKPRDVTTRGQWPKGDDQEELRGTGARGRRPDDSEDSYVL